MMLKTETFTSIFAIIINEILYSHVNDLAKPVIDSLKTPQSMHNIKMKISKRHCMPLHTLSAPMKQQYLIENDIPQMLLNLSKRK